jgi:hypothetical protein
VPESPEVPHQAWSETLRSARALSLQARACLSDPPPGLTTAELASLATVCSLLGATAARCDALRLSATERRPDPRRRRVPGATP